MAVKFQYINAFVCERVLVEQDGVVSAIRMVDVFNIPADAPSEPLIQFWLVVILKVEPPVPDEEIHLGITMVRATGERVSLPAPPQAVKLRRDGTDPTLPGGIAFLGQFNLTINNFGTAYIEADVDGKVVARVPVTFRKLPATPSLQ